MENDNNTPRVIPIALILCFIMTCTLYTSQYRSGSNETSACKYYLAGKTNHHWEK